MNRAHRPILAGFYLLLTTAAMAIGIARAEDRFIILQSTTSTQNSGLFDHILPKFEAATGILVRVVAVGTGQALRNARNGDGDVVLVHARAAEDKFVADGYGIERRDVMYNDFVLVGPADDPAGIARSADARTAFAAIAERQAPFTSRGDDSGTHKKEQALWRAAGLNVAAASGTWYRETGSGMGATLNTAVAMGAYALTDRATWLAFANKGDHKILFQGDESLFNPYGVILVNPARHPHVKAAEGRAFIAWLTGPDGRRAITEFKVQGKQLFFLPTR